MKNLFFVLLLGVYFSTYAQIDKEQLSLDVSKADAANTEQLKNFIWKRHSEVKIEGQLKLTTVTEFSFDETGKLKTKMVDADSPVEKKPGLRGKAQENAAKDKLDYVEKALELSLAYSFMTKGQLLDFFGKAVVTEKEGIIEATAKDVYVKGDVLTLLIDSKTKLFIKKKFSSLLGKDPIDGVLDYEKFSSGISHGSKSVFNMPAQKMVINAENKDYSQRVK